VAERASRSELVPPTLGEHPRTKTSQTQRPASPLPASVIVCGEVGRGQHLTGKRAEMPRQARALTRVARRRARQKNLPYQRARDDAG
jgi:hypothetical protein